jgi:hypothetical protein
MQWRVTLCLRHERMRVCEVARRRMAKEPHLGDLGIYTAGSKLAAALPEPITARQYLRQLQLASIPLEVL